MIPFSLYPTKIRHMLVLYLRKNSQNSKQILGHYVAIDN